MDDPPLIGRTIGHYVIEHKLGEGGMGAVYRAHDLHLDRRVALKVLPQSQPLHRDHERRLVQEARAASALNHPGIITIYDVNTADGITYIAMEYLTGQTLARLIGPKGLPVLDALGYAVAIADAVSAAHVLGIVHRDLKPANVMITDSGQVKVLDFGLARVSEAGSSAAGMAIATMSATKDGVIMGTAPYMSPEQIHGAKVDARSDVFSFGVLLYEMISGSRPFEGASVFGTLSAVLEHEAPLLGQRAPEVPREIERLVAWCLRKAPEKRPQQLADVKLELEELRNEFASGRLVTGAMPAIAAGRRANRAAWLAVAGAVVVAGSAAAWVWTTRAPSVGARTLTRLTSDSGLSFYPALSPDGKWLAYASDRGGGGNLDIWLRQVSGGDAIQLTHGTEDTSEPSFSPDGGAIVFRNEANGGAIFEVPTLGGAARLIASGGRRPRVSPDGQWIAYWTGAAGGAGFNEQVILASRSGDPPRRLVPEFGSASRPVWSPDGGRILFLGKRDPNARWPDTGDWWIAPAEGGPAQPTGAIDLFGRAAFVELASPDVWIPERNVIVFSRRVGDTRNLWEIDISPRTGKLTGTPRQLTFGTDSEVQASADRSAIAFSSVSENVDVWALPVDANRGVATGPLERLTDDTAADQAPAISVDGQVVAFVSNRLGNPDIWLHDAPTGRQRQVTATRQPKMYPVIANDASKIAYGSLDNQNEIYVARASDGVAEKVCSDCGLARSWSPDGSLLIYQGGEPRRFGVLVPATGARYDLAGDRSLGVYAARFSPDGKWLAFFVRVAPNHTRLTVAPFPGIDGKLPLSSSSWIAISSGEFEDDKPSWSPDGNLLYFFSSRDGFKCLWAQRIDVASRRPVDPPFAVQHFHRARVSMSAVLQDFQGMGVGVGRIVFSLSEVDGNIWLSKPSGPNLVEPVGR